MIFRREKKNSGGGGDSAKQRSWWSRCRRRLLAALLAAVAGTYSVGLLLSLITDDIKGMNVASEAMAVNPANLDMLFDITGRDGNDERVVEQEIFDTLLTMIEEAESEIVLDMFLVNRFRGDGDISFYRDLSRELVQALAERKQQNPDVFILFITDPINSGYQVLCPPDFQPLLEAGVHIVFSDLHQLPDSNYVYSPFYRSLRHLNFILAPIMDLSFLPHPFDAEKENFSLRQFARLLNFKANHRKVAAVRRADGNWSALITSGNPHSASSAHGNIAILLKDQGPIQEIVFSEYNLARAFLLRRPELYFGPWAASELVRELERRVRDWPAMPTPYDGDDKVMVQYLTELEVARRLDHLLVSAEAGKRIELMMFYLSDPDVIAELKAAAERGAEIRLLLDPNKDAFGREKHGVPNRVTAARLHQWAAADDQRDLRLRWFDTHGEQAHFKAIRVVDLNTGYEQIMVGSANFTVRNLRGYNLESVLYLENARAAGASFGAVFERLWNNQNGFLYTTDYDGYSETGLALGFKRVLKFIGNTTGLCTY